MESSAVLDRTKERVEWLDREAGELDPEQHPCLLRASEAMMNFGRKIITVGEESPNGLEQRPLEPLANEFASMVGKFGEAIKEASAHETAAS